MNQTHLHLMMVHLPIFGSMIGAFVLIQGIWSKSDTVKMASYSVFILSCLGAIIAYLSGESAEKSVEDLPGVLEYTIHRHEEFATYALAVFTVLGLASIVGFFLTMGKSSMARMYSYMVLLIALVSFGISSRTGYLGGQIRHTELHDAKSSGQNISPNDASSSNSDEQEEEED